jgi:peptidoglycan/xylan/chitin deacetylase (PgdA/CDA1 family)
LSGGKKGSPPERAVLFPASGLAILRSPLASGEALQNQTWAMLDAGPWRGTHIHLSRLSLILYAAGRVVLPDSGLYEYAPDGSDTYYDSDYFYSTAAHNTVVIDGINQTREQHVGDGQTIASPDGWSYQSGWTTTAAGVKHRRAVIVMSQDTVLVVDELDGTGSHSYAQTWHLAPDLSLSQVGLNTFGLDKTGARVLAIRQGLADGLSFSSSADGTLTSWYSDTYGQKVQNPVVAYGARGTHQTYVTLITTGSLAARDAHVSASTVGEGISAQICAGGQETSVQIDHLASTGEHVAVSLDAGACQAGWEPAVVSVTKPAPHAPTTGMTTLAAEASGPLPITRVEFAVNGTPVGTATAAPFQVNWDSRSVPDGSLVAVTATAYDSARGKTTSLARDVTVSNPIARSSPTIVSLTFDDSLSDQYAVEPMLAAHGMHATFYVISGRIDSDGYLTTAQLKQLAADGNEIGGHTVDHILLPTLPRDEQLRQVCNNRNRLLALGFAVTTFAYPFSGHDASVADVVRQCGFNGARMPGLGGRNAVAGPIKPANPYLTPSVSSFTSDTTLAEMIASVTAAEQSGGGWVPLVFHNICFGMCRNNAVSPDTFSAFIGWLSARSGAGTSVRTVAEVIGGPVQPPVSPPAPAAFGSALNLLANPDLESADQLRPGQAACWLSSVSNVLGKSGLPTVDGTVTLTADSLSGSVAARLTVSAVRDFARGDLRFMVRQDEGGCAPPAVGGHRYTVSAWYKSTVPVRLSLTYRDETGKWRMVGFSPWFAAASNWTLATWTTLALPADARNVAVRFSIGAVGTATVDEFTLSRSVASGP